MSRKTALVVCPGRGTYNKEELGYLSRYHGGRADLIAPFDSARSALGQETLSALDGAERYSLATHSRGDNASALIYACALADFQAIDRERYEVVAVTGNSMGWYVALACGGALDAMGGFQVVNSMGSLMQEALIGGQLLYPFVDENWRAIPGKRDELVALTREIANLQVSIHLGGMIVFAGDAAALEAAEKRLEPIEGRFPMRLANHAAFHTPLQAPVAGRGRERLAPDLFSGPDLPLIDGRGHLWNPHATDPVALWDYTLGHQVLETYDFTAAVRNSLREFAPDSVIVLGPGATLGGAIAQILIAENWQGLSAKADFITRQAEDPFVLAMGLEEQGARVRRT